MKRFAAFAVVSLWAAVAGAQTRSPPPSGGGGGIVSLGVTLPLASTGGRTPTLSCPTCITGGLTSTGVAYATGSTAVATDASNFAYVNGGLWGGPYLSLGAINLVATHLNYALIFPNNAASGVAGEDLAIFSQGGHTSTGTDAATSAGRMLIGGAQGGNGSGSHPGAAGTYTEIAGQPGGAGTASAAPGIGGDVLIMGAPAGAAFSDGAPQANGGNVFIRAGKRSGLASGADGILYLGNQSVVADGLSYQGATSQVIVGDTGAPVTISGALAVNSGLSASGASSIDWSGSTGTWKTPTGAATFGGSSNAFTNGATMSGALAVNGGLTASGASSIDWSGSTGTFKTPTGAATFSGSSNTFTTTTTTHPIGGGSAPTIAVGSVTQLGTSPSASITKGTDSGFTLDIVTGSAPAAFAADTAYTVATVTFASAWPSAPTAITCMPAGQHAAAQLPVLYANNSSTTTTTMTLQMAANGTPTLTNGANLFYACRVQQ